MTARKLASGLALELEDLAWKARQLACRIRLGDHGLADAAGELVQKFEQQRGRAHLLHQVLGGSPATLTRLVDTVSLELQAQREKQAEAQRLSDQDLRCPLCGARLEWMLWDMAPGATTTAHCQWSTHAYRRAEDRDHEDCEWSGIVRRNEKGDPELVAEPAGGGL